MNRASHKDLAQNSAWDSPGPILEGAWTLLGASWALLGRLWGALGQFLVPLGRFLGTSWALLGRSWASLGWSVAPFGCILPPRDASGLDFGGFGDVPGWVLEDFGGMFWHAFCCASHFITFCFYLCSDHAFAFTCAFHSYLLVRRSVRSTSAAPVGCCVLDRKQDTAKYSPERPIRKNPNTWQIWNPPYNPYQGVRAFRRSWP